MNTAFHNAMDNMTATVTHDAGRYIVQLRDDDSGCTLPDCRIFDNEPAAIHYARQLIGVLPGAVASITL